MPELGEGIGLGPCIQTGSAYLLQGPLQAQVVSYYESLVPFAKGPIMGFAEMSDA